MNSGTVGCGASCCLRGRRRSPRLRGWLRQRRARRRRLPERFGHLPDSHTLGRTSHVPARTFKQIVAILVQGRFLK